MSWTNCWQQRDDHSGIWRFAQALQAFRRDGDTEEPQRSWSKPTTWSRDLKTTCCGTR